MGNTLQTGILERAERRRNDRFQRRRRLISSMCRRAPRRRKPWRLRRRKPSRRLTAFRRSRRSSRHAKSLARNFRGESRPARQSRLIQPVDSQLSARMRFQANPVGYDDEDPTQHQSSDRRSGRSVALTPAAKGRPAPPPLHRAPAPAPAPAAPPRLPPQRRSRGIVDSKRCRIASTQRSPRDHRVRSKTRSRGLFDDAAPRPAPASAKWTDRTAIRGFFPPPPQNDSSQTIGRRSVR